MSSETRTSAVGGFAGDPATAFTPPSAGSCCGSTPSGQESAQATAGCCGTDTAVAASSCCGAAPVSETAEPVTTTGCCG